MRRKGNEIPCVDALTSSNLLCHCMLQFEVNNTVMSIHLEKNDARITIVYNRGKWVSAETIVG